MMKKAFLAIVLVLFAAQAASFAADIDKVELSPARKVGGSVVQIAYLPGELEWLVTQQYFVVDGRRHPLPPARLGYDRVFSSPRWKVSGQRISALRYWEFDKVKSLRRWVQVSFPSYQLQGRGRWEQSPGSDTVPDPPR